MLKIEDAVNQVMSKGKIVVDDVTKGYKFEVNLDVTDRNREILIEGGLINYVRKKDKV